MPISAEERRAIGLTLAGEIDPRMSPYSDPTTAVEAANILATIENRFQANTPKAFGKAKAKSYATRVDVAKQPRQYSTWNAAESRAVAKANYDKFGPTIDGIVDGFYNGTVKPSVPKATHYYSPSAMAATQGKKAPGWAGKMKGVAQQGAHVFGTIDGPKRAKSLPETGPVPTAADPERRAVAVAQAQGLLAAPKVQTAGLLSSPKPAAALGLLSTPQPAVGAASALAQMAAASPSVPLSSMKATPVSAPANRVAAISATPAMSVASMARAAPAVSSLSATQETNLADRLGAPVQAVTSRGLLGSPRLAPGTMLTPNAMVAQSPVANIASPAPKAVQSPFDNEMDKHRRNVADGLAAQAPAIAAPAAPVPANPMTPVRAATPAMAYTAPTPAFSTAKPKMDAIGQPPIPGLQRVAPATPATPALAPAVSSPSRRVASVPAAIEAAQPAPARQSPVSIGTGLGAPDVPDAPGLGAQIASRLGNTLSQNKGRMIGGLLGNVVGGPIGGLLGGYIGNRVQQGNTPQMSKQALGAIDDGNFDGFSHGVNKNAGLLGGLFGSGGLLGGMFGGGLRAPSVPGAPMGQRNYSVGGGGGPSMSSAAKSAMDSGGFDGFSHDSGGNRNTSKSSASKGSSKSSGGKKK